MKIVTNNVDVLLKVELSKICELVNIEDNPKGAFIQWGKGSDNKLFHTQTTIISHCMKNGIPLIIFDKWQQMTNEEITFLVKPGVFLWEPALNDRMFFSYQPNWGSFPDSIGDIPWDFDETRQIDLGYFSSLVKKLPSFQKYYQPIAEIGEYNVTYFKSDDKNVINDKVSKMGVNVDQMTTNLRSIRTSILIGTEREYQTGYISPLLFECLDNGIVPLLPKEHKWFHSIFEGMVVANNFDIEYLLKTYDKIGCGLIYGVYSGLNEYLPESNVVNVAKRITSFFE